jgi:hypothetical protein
MSPVRSLSWRSSATTAAAINAVGETLTGPLFEERTLARTRSSSAAACRSFRAAGILGERIYAALVRLAPS